MVFGWGKKKKEESREEFIQNKEIKLSDVRKVVTDLLELRTSQTISEIKNLRNSTAPLINELIKIGNHLEKDDLNVDDIDKHLAIIVVRGKKQVIDMIKKGVTPLPKVSSIDDAVQLNDLLNHILKKIGDVLGRQTRVIHIFAKKYASQLKENLEIMNSNHAEIRKILQNFDSTKKSSEYIINTMDEITSLKQTKIEKIQKISDTNNNIESLQEQSISLLNSIQEIKSSESYQNYIKLKQDLDEFESEKSRIKNDIDAQFTKISRPLSRYEYASSLEKDQKIILTKLVNNPFDVLNHTYKDSVILILENIRKAITSDSISVKDVDKTMTNLTETEIALDSFVNRVSDYQEKHDKMLKDLKSLKPAKLDSLESELTKTSSFQEDYLQKSKTLQSEIDEIDSKIPKLFKEIESKLREYSNTKYTLLTS
ncbi:MAG: exonuclease SbcC [Nitrosopumilus sp.]|uniref:exonuclease SbcC n=1 Tax=Nitrosopumilus sp. TaxID=2024843 RepID=UPI00247D5A99|nr:exonuclease SbcC [Nitrosopumilus sp.]MCV0392058.1 exonuclease SbcC [Nitrosopumilus sp.]